MLEDEYKLKEQENLRNPKNRFLGFAAMQKTLIVHGVVIGHSKPEL